MKRFAAAACLAASVLLAGCASGPGGAPSGDVPTASDQTDNQRRARIRMQLAMGYYEQRQTATALDEIKQAIIADPNFAEAYSMRALIYMEMGENRLAEENFQHALRLAPNNPDFHNNYGWFLCQTGRPEQSIRYFQTAADSRTYQSPGKAMNNAGMCSLRMKNIAAAERYFQEAFRLEPGLPSINANLAKLHYDKGEFEQAQFYASRLTKAEIATPDVLLLAIKIERKLGDRIAENALAIQLRRRFPNSAEFAAYQRGNIDD